MKYLLITSTELNERNISVISCTESNDFNTEKLKLALSEHFDAEIQVNSIEELSIHPLSFIAKCSNEELDMFNIELNETWLY